MKRQNPEGGQDQGVVRSSYQAGHPAGPDATSVPAITRQRSLGRLGPPLAEADRPREADDERQSRCLTVCRAGES